jgi:uridine phosphorylase
LSEIYSKIPDTDLILNDDSSVYHLRIRPQDLADTIIIVGHPDHLNLITKHFSEILFISNNREFASQTGLVRGKTITALSTGVGTSKADIVMNELDAVKNIDFIHREQLQNIRATRIIGIRITNTIQSDLPPGSIFLTAHVIGLDNMMNYYRGLQGITDADLKLAFNSQIKRTNDNIIPYFLKGSESLKSIFIKHFMSGITVTVPGFYGPQGRYLRIPLKTNMMLDKLKLFSYNNLRILNLDMDTSAYYAFGALMGHEVITINAVVASTLSAKDGHEISSVFEEIVDIVLKEILTL